MTSSNKITSMCIMSLVLLVGYSLGGISGMNFQDRMAYATSSLLYVILDNQSNQKFTLQKVTKEHYDTTSSIPKTLEPGKHYTITGVSTTPVHDAITHLYYTYGEKYTAEFSAWFEPVPINKAIKCSHEGGSSEISISCSKPHENKIQFTIKNAN
ncbi:MAG: hypothetical protein ACPKPY_04145 [Nitrososphaeraceae archaeon]